MANICEGDIVRYVNKNGIELKGIVTKIKWFDKNINLYSEPLWVNVLWVYDDGKVEFDEEMNVNNLEVIAGKISIS